MIVVNMRLFWRVARSGVAVKLFGRSFDSKRSDLAARGREELCIANKTSERWLKVQQFSRNLRLCVSKVFDSSNS